MRDHESGPVSGCADDVRDALPALLHGRIAGAEHAHVAAHVAGCAECAAELALLRDVRSALTAGAPRLDLDAVAASVRAATMPHPASRGAAVRPATRAPAWAVPSGARVAGARWRPARAWSALAATVLVAVGSGAVLLGRGQTAAGPGTTGAAGSASPAAPAVVAAAATRPAAEAASRHPASPAVRSGAAPAMLASSDAALGVRFDDLTDEELQAVVDAVGGAEGALPSAEPEAVMPLVPGGGA